MASLAETIKGAANKVKIERIFFILFFIDLNYKISNVCVIGGKNINNGLNGTIIITFVINTYTNNIIKKKNSGEANNLRYVYFFILIRYLYFSDLLVNNKKQLIEKSVKRKKFYIFIDYFQPYEKG